MTDVAKTMAPLLSDLGLKKRAGGQFTRELSEDVLGWLGLNQDARHRPAGEVLVHPVVGIRHQAVERIVAECRGAKFHPYVPPTVCKPLSSLISAQEYIAWVFNDMRADTVAADLTQAIAEHGLPFMHANAMLPELCQRLEEGMGHEYQRLYCRPVAWLLAGDAQRAHRVLDDELGKLGARKDLAAQDLRRFAAALNERLDVLGESSPISESPRRD